MRVAVVSLANKDLSGGYLKYLRTLLPLLQNDARVSALSPFVPRSVAHKLPIDSGALHFFDSAPVAGSSRLRKLVEATKPDVVFIPSARYLDFGDTPAVVMVRNMEPLGTPFRGNRLSVCCVNFARRAAARRACNRATRIIAVSEYVKAFLVNRWAIDPHKLAVVYHGVDKPVKADHAAPPEALRGGLRTPWFFTAGSIRPARGMEDVIRALAIVNRHEPCQLVIGGTATSDSLFYRAAMGRLAEKSGVSSRVVWAGQLNPAEMSWCYSNCVGFVMTSRVEACPNIALEGMAHGCLCISTENPPMPEFFGNAAWYYPAGDAEVLARHLRRALNSPDKVCCHEDLSFRRSQDFRWEETARLTVDALTFATFARGVQNCRAS